MGIHVPSLFLFSAQMTLVIAAALLWVSRNQLSGGLKACGLGLFFFALGLPVLGLREVIPETLSVLAGNALISLALGCLQAAIYRFQHRAIRYEIAAGPIVLLVLVLALQMDDYRGRAITAGLVFAFQAGAIAVTAHRDQQFREGNGRGLVVFSAGLLAAIMLIRSLLTLTGIHTPDIVTEGNSLDIATFTASHSALMLFTLGFFTMINERAEARNRKLATRDELTGVPNRRELLRTLKNRIKEARRLGYPLTVLMLDIDHFKPINDRHGHLAGDAVLKELARVMDNRLRGQDTLGRYGGEEFLAILPHTRPEDGARVAEDLLARIRAIEVAYRHATLRVQASIGVYGAVPAQEDTSADFVRGADEAMYLAKENGRNRVEIATADPGRYSEPAVNPGAA